MVWPNTVVLVALAMSQATDLPPPFPRPGTTSILENDVVAVWNVSWLKQQYPLHTHRYDLIGISYMEGDRIITQGTAPGRLTHTRAWAIELDGGAAMSESGWRRCLDPASATAGNGGPEHDPPGSSSQAIKQPGQITV